MTTTKTRVSQLKSILSLQKKRTRLLSQLATLDSQIADRIEKEIAVSGKEARSAAPKPAQVVISGRSRRGGLRDQILEALEAAGASGITVRELADKLAIKAANIHTWFSTNTKRIPALKKAGEAHYVLKGAAGKAEAPAKAAKPARAAKATKAAKPAAAKAAKPARAAKAAKPAAPRAKAVKAAKAPRAAKATKPAAKKAAVANEGEGFTPAKRGELKTSVLEELKKAGAEGITVNDLAEKVGTRYKNLYIWFVTTGKRIPGIEKVGPARYRLTA